MKIREKDMIHLAYIQREGNFVHHTYEDERQIFDLIRRGDRSAAEVDSAKFRGSHNGHMSNDPVKDKKYLFVVEATLAARAAIEGGLEEQTAYNMGDLYVQKMDRCQEIEQIIELHKSMIEDYTERVYALRFDSFHSKPVHKCLEYIHWNLHKKVTLQMLADHVDLTPSYLSALFKKKTGLAVSDYVMKKKIEAAENMLRYTEMPYSEIAATLSFSSQSHFIRAMKGQTGMTPRQYRNYFHKKDEELMPFIPVRKELYEEDL